MTTSTLRPGAGSRPLAVPGPDHRERPVLDVVIPVYNEETDLEPCVRRLHEHLATQFPYPFHLPCQGGPAEPPTGDDVTTGAATTV